MNKSELARVLALQADIPENEATLYVDVFFYQMRRAMLDGNRVEIRGFGSFKIKDYAPYTGRNPKTGELVDVKPKKLPFFKAGRELKEFINKE
ncbi:MAG: integration host factor subunit beta [Desulfovibrio sp.]|nr:integration host factor subunit beta [Desulfovibrio sp.]